MKVREILGSQTPNNQSIIESSIILSSNPEEQLALDPSNISFILPYNFHI